jgi:hypothetical protein
MDPARNAEVAMKRTAGWTATITLAMGMIGLAQQPESKPVIAVCLTFSEGLAIDAPLKGAILSEVRRVWEPLGVLVGEKVADTSCDRPILIKSDREATREDGGGETAIAWVTFVAGRARQLVFVRMGRARMLVDAFSPAGSGMRPPGLTDQLLAKLLGRSLAHELGHVLLNSLAHERSGLMRARYGAHDVLRDLPSGYTLNADQRQRLLALARLDAQMAAK